MHIKLNSLHRCWPPSPDGWFLVYLFRNKFIGLFGHLASHNISGNMEKTYFPGLQGCSSVRLARAHLIVIVDKVTIVTIVNVWLRPINYTLRARVSCLKLLGRLRSAAFAYFINWTICRCCKAYSVRCTVTFAERRLIYTQSYRTICDKQICPATQRIGKSNILSNASIEIHFLYA